MASVAIEDDAQTEATLRPEYNSEECDFGDGTASDLENATCYYDWLADSVTTSHVTNRRNAFLTYRLLSGLSVGGIGRSKTRTIGRGDINLISVSSRQKYLLKLHDVIHIPENKNNLFSLGRWEKQGCSFHVVDGKMALHMKDGTVVARGTKIRDTLYKMQFSIAPASADITCAFNSIEQLPTWETWHHQFGHVSYRGIKKLHNLQLVDGLHINTASPWPDCVPCTEAKLSQLPFGEVAPHITKPGELMHMDL